MVMYEYLFFSKTYIKIDSIVAHIWEREITIIISEAFGRRS